MQRLRPQQLNDLPYGAIVEVRLPSGEVQRFAKLHDPRYGTLWVLTENAVSKLTDRTMFGLAMVLPVRMPGALLGRVVPLDEPLPEGAVNMSDGSPGGYAYIRPRR